MTGRSFFLIIAGFFLIIFIANGFLVYFATSSWTGLETKNAYEKGIKHDSELARARSQDESNFKVSVAVNFTPDKILQLSVNARDGSDAPLLGKTVTALVVRPVKEGFDTTINLVEKKPGIYRGAQKLPLAGNWDIKLSIMEADKVIFRSRSRVVLK